MAWTVVRKIELYKKKFFLEQYHASLHALSSALGAGEANANLRLHAGKDTSENPAEF